MDLTTHLLKRVIERRIRRKKSLTENQFSFMLERSTVEAVYLLRGIIEQYRMDQQDLHLIFIDIEKTYDRVSRDILKNS